MRIICCGINYRRTPLEIREKISVPEKEYRDFVREFLKEGASEAVLISTCNRTETYLVGTDSELCIEIAKKVLFDRAVPREVINSYLYINIDMDAILHLFKVASGLDSMIIGEPQILGQVKRAFKIATESGTVGPYLNQLFSMAFRAAKEARTRTAIGEGAISTGYAILELSRRIFGAIEKTDVCLIGAGEIAEDVITYFADRSKSLFVASRTFERAKEFTKKFGGVPKEMEQLLENLDKFDVVICSTASKSYVITERHITSASKKRKNRTMLVVDLSVPRNVDPECAEVGNVFLYTVDDLKRVVEKSLEARRKEAKKAREIIIEIAKDFNNWLHTRKVSPAIKAVRLTAEDIRKREFEAFFSDKNFTQNQLALIDKFSKRLMNEFVKQFITKLKTTPNRDKALEYAKALEDMFKEIKGGEQQ